MYSFFLFFNFRGIVELSQIIADTFSHLVHRADVPLNVFVEINGLLLLGRNVCVRFHSALSALDGFLLTFRRSLA